METMGINGLKLHDKCPYLKLFWSVFSRIWYFPNSVQMWENTARIELFFVSVFFQKNLNFYFFNSKNYGEIFWLDGLLKNMLKFEVPGL